MIFNISSILRKQIRLTDKQWAHIRYKHKELDNQLQLMKLTLQEPDAVYYSPQAENYHYYKYFTQTPVSEKYLLLIVKHLNKEGFIITSFLVAKIKREGKEVVYEKDIHTL
jgi:hypothetical protein